MKLTDREVWKLVTKTVISWKNDHAQSMGAALAFYTMFSIAPLLLIVAAVGGYFFGAGAIEGEIHSVLSALMGSNGARAIERIVASEGNPARRTVAEGVVVVVFLVTAMSVFNELQDSLNRIWRVHSKPRPKASGILSFLRARLLSLGMILGIAVLLMVSLTISFVIAAFVNGLQLTSPSWEFLRQVLSSLVSLALMTATIAVIYKVVPQARVLWRDVWIGAATTSVLFIIGKKLIGLYLGRSGVESVFGAVSSLAVFLLWVYYSAQIFLVGAEFTWIYSNEHGGRRKLGKTDASGRA